MSVVSLYFGFFSLIVRCPFDKRNALRSGLYGTGNYFALESSKVLQYALAGRYSLYVKVWQQDSQHILQPNPVSLKTSIKTIELNHHPNPLTTVQPA